MSTPSIETSSYQLDQNLFLRLSMIDKSKLKIMIETFLMIFSDQGGGNLNTFANSITIEKVKSEEELQVQDYNDDSKIKLDVDLNLNDETEKIESLVLETRDENIEANINVTTRKHHECQHCKVTFKKKKNLERHINSKHFVKEEAATDLVEQNIWECYQCGKTFSSEICYEKHMKTKHSMETEEKEMKAMKKCDFCEMEFSVMKSNIKIITHLKSIHSNKDIIEIIKLLEKEETKTSVCNICGKEFRNKHILTTHINTIHSEVDTRKCNFCELKFNVSKSNLRLITHLKNIHTNKDINGLIEALEDEDAKIICNFCGRKMRNKYSLASHIKLIHSELEVAPCHICGKMLKQHENIIYYHLQSHNDFPCEFCGVVLGSKSSYKEHKAVHLPGFKKLECDECHLQFDRQAYLHRHKQRIHSGKNYKNKKCDTCGKMLSSWRKLRDHISAVHLQEKPYSCDLCDHKTARKENLTIHRKGKHGIEYNLSEIEKEMLQSAIEWKAVIPSMEASHFDQQLLPIE